MKFLRASLLIWFSITSAHGAETHARISPDDPELKACESSIRHRDDGALARLLTAIRPKIETALNDGANCDLSKTVLNDPAFANLERPVIIAVIAALEFQIYGGDTENRADERELIVQAVCREAILFQRSGSDGFAHALAEISKELPVKKKQTVDFSSEEITEMRRYTGQGFREVNEPLRSHPNEPNHHADVINAGLEKLPDHRGLVYRGITSRPIGLLGPNSVLVDRLNPGEIFEFPAFTSTSEMMITATSFGRMRISILSLHGKVLPQSVLDERYDDEFEVLFKSKTRFKLLDVDESHGTSLFLLKEVPQ